MAGSMQILVLEKGLYELEEKVKKYLKQIEEKVDLQDEKFKEYEKFLRGFEGGTSFPKKVEEEHKKKIKRRIKDGEKEK